MSTETKAADTGTPNPDDNIRPIAIDNLQELKGHAFKPYTGKRLDQLTQSIRENGVMQHIIVRPTKNAFMFEIISGHNRVKAAEQAGLKEVPAVVRKMSDDEAHILANETNVTQRSFKDWLPSEKAKSIYQYHEAVKKQGKRSVKRTDTSGGNSQKEDDYARTKTAKVYGVKGNIIRLYLDIYRLKEELMDKLNDGDFGVTAAQTLSFISPEGQILLNEVLEGDRDSCKVTVENSQKVRSLLEGCQGKDADEVEMAKSDIRKFLAKADDSEVNPSIGKVKNIPMDDEHYEYYFSDRPIEAVAEEVLAAMKSYRENNSDKTGETSDNPELKDSLQSKAV